MRTLVATLLAGVSAFAVVHPAFADTDEERDARIARLEAAVEALAGENAELRREVADLRATRPATTAPTAPPAPAQPVQVASASPNQPARIDWIERFSS